MIITYRFRLKDKHTAALNAKARAVNFVWNYANETQQTAVRRGRKWFTGFDLGRLCSGSSKELGISADTIEEICKQYARSRMQHRRPWLRFRGRKSLGWVPFKKRTARIDGRARLALDHDLIFVGNVSGKQLAQTNMAKSVLDAGWSTLRTQLSYKAMRHKGRMIEVDERMTTQVCSACGSVPEGRPRGIADLGIREWECGDCGAVHDRDVNAALNILRLGQETLAEGAVL